jgi:hypothetical protein
MKHILDSSFRYRPSFDTDVRKTFEKIRRQQQPDQKSKADNGSGVNAPRVKILQLDQLKKASST